MSWSIVLARRFWATTLHPDPLKKLWCLTRSVGRTYDKYWRVEKYAISLGIAGLRHPSVNRIGRYTDQFRCILAPVAVWKAGIHVTRAKTGSPPASERIPQAQLLLGEVRFIAWNLRWLLVGNAYGVWGLLCLPGVTGLRPCAWTQLKMSCATLIRLVGRTTNTETYAKLRWN